jgi:hypothetical protein
LLPFFHIYLYRYITKAIDYTNIIHSLSKLYTILYNFKPLFLVSGF